MTETQPEICRLGYARVSTAGRKFAVQLEAKGCVVICRDDANRSRQLAPSADQRQALATRERRVSEST